jgi:predicted signal transduction protein with EAL and GGDEF domain
VAEGVEDRATWDQLTELGCTSAQGYYLARPMAAERFWTWLQDAGSSPARAPITVVRARPAMVVRPNLTPVPPR